MRICKHCGVRVELVATAPPGTLELEREWMHVQRWGLGDVMATRYRVCRQPETVAEP
ncbi:hypothetical protein C1Y40_04130 [Mycobacterium talmoniae]|uniref:Uncharacterized protein n=1 Tax=Mycobacterium talmoniae TaxID=1858794 RepID=A0A2S8BGD8_9MYCO|nr:hypothetical protein C1Y40_04130 [Mycobacterium talmoniae]